MWLKIVNARIAKTAHRHSKKNKGEHVAFMPSPGMLMYIHIPMGSQTTTAMSGEIVFDECKMNFTIFDRLSEPLTFM